MKNRIFYLLAVMAVFASAFTSCLKDNSEFVGTDMGTIEITGLQDKYEATSFVGYTLSLNPEIKSDYKNYTYEWTLLTKKTGSVDSKGDTIQPVLLGEDKTLDLPINLAPGNYQIRFKCSVETGYSKIVPIALSVVTEFSKGWYIMKETADGNTDLDLYTSSGALTSDVIKGVHGASLSGAPKTFNIAYAGFYINTETDAIETTNKLFVTTKSGNFASYRSTDMSNIADRTNLKFDPMDDSEEPLTMVSTEMYELLYTNNGIYSVMNDNMFIQYGYYSPNSGRFGMPNVCNPTNVVIDFAHASGAGLVWDEEAGTIYWQDTNGPIDYAMDVNLNYVDEVADLVGVKCVGCGTCVKPNISYFILEDADGNRSIPKFTGKYIRAFYAYMPVFTSMVSVDPASHLAKASLTTACGLQASYIYCIDGGKFYAANVSTDNLVEMELALEGLPAGEKITYLSNQYIQFECDYLVVGTESGSDYHLYFYQMTNGIPTGQPAFTISGKGKVKSARYLSDTYDNGYARSILE